jgi:hypothetical protein
MGSAKTSTRSRRRTVELLADEAQVPVGEVAALYESVHAELESGARIRGFLDIFAMRKVRELLGQRKA